jgi:hypothetical protein
MDRRKFVAGLLGTAAAAALAGRARVAPLTAELPALEITLTDTGFDFPQPLQAGRYEVTVANTGTSAESHFGLGKIPDRVTDAEYEVWLTGYGEDTAALTFDDIEFVGVPDWPRPGGSVSGAIDLAPGRYFLFDPFDARGYQTLAIDGTFTAGEEPAADLTVELREMEIVFPEAAFTSQPARWKIANLGAMTHEVAVLPVSPDFTEEHLHLLFSLPEDATPPPEVPEFVYQPVAAIGTLAKQHASWLDVQLAPGRYLGICMLPFGTGYPHGIDGMYRFFDVE